MGNHTGIATKIAVKVEIAVEIKAIQGTGRVVLKVEKLAQSLMVDAIAKFYQVVVQLDGRQKARAILVKASNHIGNVPGKTLLHIVLGIAKLEGELLGQEFIDGKKIF
jgi:hypothetical protein